MCCEHSPEIRTETSESRVRTWECTTELVALGGQVLVVHGRTRTDPTVWQFSSDALGTTYALVADYVDDFIFTGIAGKGFEHLKNGLRERFRWGSWKLPSFGLFGVRVHKRVDLTIDLDKTSCVSNGINPINVDTNRDLDRSLTSADITNLRGAWGAMQWKVTQTGPALSELQPKISQQTLKLITETSKHVSDVKLNKKHVSIHPFSRHPKWNDLALIGYTDAAKSDRSDGGSTGGYVLTMDPYRQFIEGHFGRRTSSSVLRGVH